MNKGYFDRNTDEWIVPIADKHGNSLHLRKDGLARNKYSHKEKTQFQVQKLVWAQQSDYPEKIIILEEIVWADNRTELRLGYYTTSRTGHWWWGQYAVMIPKKDLEELLAYAVEKQILSLWS